MQDARRHNCYKKLMKLIQSGKIRRDALSEVDICHDGWCRIYRGGYCNCNPDIRLRLPPERN